jgi:hypothetical protein
MPKGFNRQGKTFRKTFRGNLVSFADFGLHRKVEIEKEETAANACSFAHSPMIFTRTFFLRPPSNLPQKICSHGPKRSFPSERFNP